ncbi:MAG: hypothetical protein GF328_00400 [Candidatus Latescibacteria bacterium]|nr:hypothetical protein [Candidatus Latescibacterota bacterium]
MRRDGGARGASPFVNGTHKMRAAKPSSLADTPEHSRIVSRSPSAAPIERRQRMRRISVLLSLLALTATAVQADWLQMASMPGQGRHHPVTFTLDGYGYVATGSTTGDNYSNDFFRYDPVADSWEVLPDFPGAGRGYAYGGTYQGKAYMGFGASPAYLNDLWEYDPDTEQWTQLASMPGSGRAHPAFIITDDGKIFVGLGNAAQNFRDWYEYDIATDEWVQHPDLPGPPRHHPYYFNIGDTPYAGFGHGAAIYSDWYRWNRDTETWTQMDYFPGEGRVAGTQFSYDGKGYILSGEGQDHQQLDYGEFYEYDSSTDTWTELTPHPGSGRWAPGSFLIDGTLYFLGGLSTVRLERDMWSFPLRDPAAVVDVARSVPRAFVVSPNPVTTGRIHLLDLSSGNGPARDVGDLRLIDARGREVAELEESAAGIDIPRVSPGRYFLSFTTANGRSHARPVLILR